MLMTIGAWQAMIDDLRPSFAMAKTTPAQACLEPLLNALGWTGSPRRLFEALPEDHEIADLPALLGVLKNLRFLAVAHRQKPLKLCDEMLPVILARDDGDIWVVIEVEKAGYFKMFKGREGRLATVSVDELEGRILTVYSVEGAVTRFSLSEFLHRSETGSIGMLLLLSLLIGGFALALPVCAMMIFDRTLDGQSTSGMLLPVFVLIAMAGIETMLRSQRARLIVKSATSLQARIFKGAFERMTSLPLSLIEIKSTGSLVKQLKSFDISRDVNASPLVAALFDLPMIAMLIAAAFYLGGWLGWLIVGFSAVLTGLSVLWAMKVRFNDRERQEQDSRAEKFRADMVRNLPVIHSAYAEEIWAQRYSRLISGSILLDTDMRRLKGWAEMPVRIVPELTALLISVVGVSQIAGGELSIGALAALLIIVWRISAPIGLIRSNIDLVFRTIDMCAQFQKLMQLAPEKSALPIAPSKEISGRITLVDASYRRTRAVCTDLKNITMTVEPGELVALTGLAPSSNLALLRMMASLQGADSGRLGIDECDIGLFDARHLRQRIALVSEDQLLFPGTSDL
ncbi:MAG: hypothetical protein KTR19_04535 [Hyphomicrobiales bacterium]|nr:hypothetical protein [Hyphomicrobiales bacterium]